MYLFLWNTYYKKIFICQLLWIINSSFTPRITS